MDNKIWEKKEEILNLSKENVVCIGPCHSYYFVFLLKFMSHFFTPCEVCQFCYVMIFSMMCSLLYRGFSFQNVDVPSLVNDVACRICRLF